MASKLAAQFGLIEGGEGVPPEPDWSQIYNDVFDIEQAHTSWGIVIRDLKEAGTLAVANGHTIKRLVEFRVQYERAAKNVADRGAIIVRKGNQIGMWNPFWNLMTKTSACILILEDALGLTPLKRGNVAQTKFQAKNMKPVDAYLAHKKTINK